MGASGTEGSAGYEDRLCCSGWRDQEFYVDENAAGETGATRGKGAIDGGIGNSCSGQRSSGFCSDGLDDMVWTFGECSRRDRGKAAGRIGEGHVRMRGVAAGRKIVRSTVSFLLVCLGMSGCRGHVEDPRTVVMIIESSPNNLDLRVGTDAQSERVGGVIFDALVKKDEHFNLQPWLAAGWEQPDVLTWVFHLRDGGPFQDGRALTAEDVAYTIESLIDGSLVTAKGGSFASVNKVE